jgi:hypothetical protein
VVLRLTLITAMNMDTSNLDYDWRDLPAVSPFTAPSLRLAGRLESPNKESRPGKLLNPRKSVCYHQLKAVSWLSWHRTKIDLAGLPSHFSGLPSGSSPRQFLPRVIEHWAIGPFFLLLHCTLASPDLACDSGSFFLFSLLFW